MYSFDQFNDHLVALGRSPHTVVAYIADMRDYGRWVADTYGEPFEPDQITRSDVVAYLASLTERHASPATVGRRLTALSAFCRWAVDQGLLASDPTNGIRAPKMVKQPPKALSRVDVNRLVRKAEQGGNLLHIAVVTLLATTGVRVDELCHIELPHIEMGERSGRLLVHGKGDKWRHVPLNSDARRALAAYMAVRPDHPSSRLLISANGTPLTTSGAWRIVRKYAELAGVDASPHVLRHTFATRLLREGGADLVMVADLLGHESVNTTARYTRSTEADQQAAVELL